MWRPLADSTITDLAFTRGAEEAQSELRRIGPLVTIKRPDVGTIVGATCDYAPDLVLGAATGARPGAGRGR